ncbi:MAG TPA: YqaJ viral recombinase family protein [Candidatus Dormibacteraeota bacterium]|nr:YqaJ viral recombinase family protein [Candidatus Dormibacteraeota bacterium]
MRFVTAEQRTAEWYQSRLGKVTASMVKNMIAYSKRGVKNKETGEIEYPELEARAKYRRQLVTERIYGMAGQEDIYINDAMRWGMLSEDLARTQYKLFSGNKVTEEGFCIHQVKNEKTRELEDVMAGCSTDGLINDDGNLEIKNLTPSNHLYEIVKHNELPDQFRDQVQFQLLVTGRQYAHFVGYDCRAPQGIDLLAVHVERDEDYINYLESEMFKFLKEVDREYYYFLDYLPWADRVCKDCGTLFSSYVNICPGCYSNSVKVIKVVREPKLNLLNNVKKEPAKK